MSAQSRNINETNFLQAGSKMLGGSSSEDSGTIFRALLKAAGEFSSDDEGGQQQADALIDQAEKKIRTAGPKVTAAVQNFKGLVDSEAAAKKNQTNTYGAMPCSMQGLLYEAMSTMSEYELQQMREFLNYMSSAAATYGGITQNTDGSLTIKLDSSGNVEGGMIGNQVALMCRSADDAAQAARETAQGYLTSAIVTTGALGMTGLSYAHTTFETQFSTPFTRKIDESSINHLEGQQQMYSEFGQKLQGPARADIVQRETSEQAAQTAAVKELKNAKADTLKATDELRVAEKKKENAKREQEAADLDHQKKLGQNSGATVDEISQAQSRLTNAKNELDAAEESVNEANRKVSAAKEKRDAAAEDVRQQNQLQKTIKARIKEIAGDRNACKDFIKETQDSTHPKNAFNKQVIEHMKLEINGDSLAKVRNHNQTLSDNTQKGIDAKNGQYTNWTRTLDMANQAGGKYAEYNAQMLNADKKQQSDKEQAVGQAVQTMNQQYQGNINDAKKTADDASQAASQVAAGFAQCKAV